MESVTRPKRGDDEKDLLKFEKEFLSNQGAPAATVVKKPDKRKQEGDKKDVVSLDLSSKSPSMAPLSNDPPKKKSRFKQGREVKKQKEFDDPEEAMEKHDMHITKVLSSIVEHETRGNHVVLPKPSDKSFPAASHRPDIANLQTKISGSKKKSLFAQQFDQGFIQATDQESCDSGSGSGSVTSRIIDGTGLNISQAEREALTVSQENYSKLALMSDDEIQKEQQQLMEMLDPKIVAFLRGKKHVKSYSETSNDSKAKPEQVTQTDKMETDSDGTKHKTTVNQSSDVPSIRKGRPCGIEVPVEMDEKWVHMDKIETEKLEWVKSLPTPKAGDSKTGQQARFDFHGNPASADEDIPVHLGLHHHGDEPERAGYTLEELFVLARSANMQQKAFGLQTIAKILQKAKQGDYVKVLQTPMLSSLIDGGLLFILRWSLDDTPGSVMLATVNCLHALLVNNLQETSLDSVFHWPDGCYVPALCAPATANKEEDEEKSETDADIIKQDVIKGLLRMDLLPRLRYILEVWRPQATTSICILEILIQIARHSTQSAHTIMNCPRLLQTIFAEFLPVKWKQREKTVLTSIHGYPIPTAVKLLRVLCAAGRNIAAILLNKYGLHDCILRYTMTDISILPLSYEESYHLVIESWRIWQICLSYGYTSEQFCDTYSLIMERIQQFPSLSSSESLHSLQVTSAILGAITAAVHLAATTHDLRKKLLASDGQDCLPVPSVNWSHVTGLLQPIEMCMTRWWTEFMNNYHFKKFDLCLLVSSTNTVVSYYLKTINQPGYDPVNCLQHIESLCSSVITPVLESQAFKALTGSLIEHSMLLHKAAPFTREIPTNLLSLCCTCLNHDEQIDALPMLSKHSPFSAVTAMCQLLVAITKLHKGLQDKVYNLVLQEAGLLGYIRRICTPQHCSFATNHFTKIENTLQFQLVKLASLKPLCDRQLYHQLSLCLFSRLHHGDEHLAHSLMSTVLFNQEFIIGCAAKDNVVTHDLSALKLSEQHNMTAATQCLVQINKTQLLVSCCRNLALVRATFMRVCGGAEKYLYRSRSQKMVIPHELDNFLTTDAQELLLPTDWMFLPIVECYQKADQITQSSGSLTADAVSMVSHCLQWILLLECWYPEIMSSVSVVTRISRLNCVFLTGNDLFLEPKIQHLLTALLQEYCKPRYLERMDFDEHIPGILSFYDLYIAVLSQYKAVSFGDSLFGCFILLPLQQRHNKKLRKTVWSEHLLALRTLFIPINQLLIPIENYLEPDETDVEIVRLYVQGLLSGGVQHRFCPVMYLVAVHHVNRFMYSREHKHAKLRDAMLMTISKNTNEELKHQLLYYKSFDINKNDGLELYLELPPSRQKTLQQLQQAK